LGRFVDSLAQVCESVLCFLHTPRLDEMNAMDYRITSPNVRLVEIGAHTSILERSFFTRRYTAFVRTHASDIDALLVRGPSPLLPAMVSSSPVPTVLLLVGDYLAGVDDLSQPRWRKEAIRFWSCWNKWGQDRAVQRSLTFVNSRVLYQELQDKTSKLHEIRTTTLTREDFFVREDTCQEHPYHLLYAGRMDRGKGLLQMVQAVALLRERGEDVILDLVGWSERGDPILDEIQGLAFEKNIPGSVCYAGPRPLGPELFVFYRNADIFLIASLASEGFPRAIWEAMAHCLPVVATRVGSIPLLVEGAACLVQPGSAEAIADGVHQLIHRPALRQEYIKQGFDCVQGITLENQTGELVQKIESWLGKIRHV